MQTLTLLLPKLPLVPVLQQFHNDFLLDGV